MGDEQDSPLPLDGSSRPAAVGAILRGSRGRGRRGRGRNRDRSHQRSLSEMSVRGLDLLRYATLAPDGTYRCIECERLQITKNFKNKYSFQRHAFLYHEGAARKVFPCTVCKKEFSRPDKMKQHLKQAHEGGGGGGGAGQNKTEDKVSPKNSPSSPETTTAGQGTGESLANVAAAAQAAVAAMAAGAISPMLVNPFLDLSKTQGQRASPPDPSPAHMESVKDS